MICEHLTQVERALIAAEVPITFRGPAWSSNCREWVYFACWLDRPAIRARFNIADCVTDHEHRGTHDGQEAGLVCNACRDAIMGVHSEYRHTVPTFP